MQLVFGVRDALRITRIKSCDFVLCNWVELFNWNSE